MKILTQLNKVDFCLLISRLNEAEISRNLEEMQSLFAVIWNDLNEEPQLEDCSIKERAEFMRLAGVFLVLYGKAENLASYQLRGKDLLSKAINYFFEFNQIEKAIESKILIATAYYQEGAIEEKQAVLEDALSYFESQPEHSLALLINVNLLIVEIKNDQLESAMNRMSETIGLITASTDNKLKTQFYTQRGVIFRLRKDYTESIASYTLALEFAKKIPNIQFEALIKNSLAMTYLDDNKLDLAMRYVDQAIDLINSIGWNANFFDTKANIYYVLGEFENALEYAERSEQILKNGDDYGSYIESLWTKIKILTRLNYQEQAINSFIILQEIASMRVSEATAKNYFIKFIKTFYLVPEGNYSEKVATFKQHLVIEALSQTTIKSQAAEILGITHQAFDDMLENQFPQIAIDFGITRKKRRTSKHSK